MLSKLRVPQRLASASVSGHNSGQSTPRPNLVENSQTFNPIKLKQLLLNSAKSSNLVGPTHVITIFESSVVYIRPINESAIQQV